MIPKIENVSSINIIIKILEKKKIVILWIILIFIVLKLYWRGSINLLAKSHLIIKNLHLKFLNVFYPFFFKNEQRDLE